MGFMDKVKETAAKGTEMAKGAAKAGQDKIDEQKAKKKLGDLKEELGGVVYAQKTGAGDGSTDAEIERLVNEIKEAEAELEAIGDADESGDAEAPATADAPAPAAADAAEGAATDTAGTALT
jgi:hypothetical protein